MKKKKATPRKESSLQNNQRHDNSARSQRARTHKALEEKGNKGLSTIQLRENYDVMSPAPRVLELRRKGIKIVTVWTVTENAQGHKHRCARYVLLAHKVGVTA